ncbi:MAG TPA: DUF4157 domain-containing protein [Blastocatellia bacterium]|nr:DUF4157 domain-containing protein [Blastocatellia bacterium]
MGCCNAESSRDQHEPLTAGTPQPQLSARAEPRDENSTIQSSLGNAAMAACAASNPHGDCSNMLSLQSSYGNAAVARGLIQRKAAGEGYAGGVGAAAGDQEATAGATPAQGVIVEDTAATLQPGQMKKSDFLSQLRAAVTQVAEESSGAVGAVGASVYISQWYDRYSGQSGRQIEQAVRAQVPEAAGANSAGGYIAAVTARVRRELSPQPGTGEGSGSTGGGLVEGVASAIGGILFKERSGGARGANDPQAIRAQLGEGRALDGVLRSRMESSFGEDFSHVRVHTDARAAGLSSGLNARAFTIGEHVAFGSGEYQPGTLIGDALIAHELAHTIQQGSGASGALTSATSPGSSSGLEQEADQAAFDMLKTGRARVRPGRSRGLSLQRCGFGLPGAGFSPLLFAFHTVLPNPTPGQPGGWQETSVVTLRFSDGRTGNTWSCRLIVGAPVESYLGPVDPTAAAVSAATAATTASTVVMHSRPAWLGEADYCPAFRTAMQATLAGLLPGARVSSPSGGARGR